MNRNGRMPWAGGTLFPKLLPFRPIRKTNCCLCARGGVVVVVEVLPEDGRGVDSKNSQTTPATTSTTPSTPTTGHR